jgi:methyl-accepting chemotaxis protein
MNASMADLAIHAKATVDAAEEGRTVADEVLRSAVDTQASGERLAAHTSTVASHAHRFADLCTLIRDLANQTDLLSVNAAAEGARGRAPHPDSLVHAARKMRRIAARAQTAATEFEQLDGELRAAAAAAVLAAEEASKCAGATLDLARAATSATTRQQVLATATLTALGEVPISSD